SDVVAVRREGGPFVDVFDFVERVDVKQVNKRTFETLARAGAFDTIHPNRAELMAAADVLIGHGQALAADRAEGKRSLFGDDPSGAHRPRLPKTDAWTPVERLDEELSAVG